MDERKIEKGNCSDRLASYTLASINQNIKRFAPSNIPTKLYPVVHASQELRVYL